MASNRLEPIDLTDFTGGWNTRRDQFTLADNESPDMLNVEVDPRGGFYTRKGWRRWTDDELGTYTPGTVWSPMNAASHTYATGDQVMFLVESNAIYAITSPSINAVLPEVTAEAQPHGADFVSWGDDVYIACGVSQPSVRYNADGTVTTLTGGTWSEVDAPTGNTMPQAEYTETHAGYVFVAATFEDGATQYSRVRWSHPNRPDAWRQLDYIDINAEGGRITAIVSFLDHLLIFKSNSVWALYGYDESSWQLTCISSSIGCPSIAAVGWSETEVYFFSSSNLGGIYAYNGNQPVYLSDKTSTVFEQVRLFDQVCVSWAARRLYVSVPWHALRGPQENPTSLLVFDPNIGDGAWLQYRCESGAVTCVIQGSDIRAKAPVAAFWSDQTATLVQIDAIDDAYDEILQIGSLAVMPDDGYLVTDIDAEILTAGVPPHQWFESYYRTRWLNGGWPDRRKSWRRPTFICRGVPRQVDLLVQQYRDYDETTIRRTGIVPSVTQGGNVWGGGSRWGDGSTWGAAIQGAEVIRGASMGHAAAIQMKVLPSDATPMRKWGVDGIVVKLTSQRFRT